MKIELVELIGEICSSLDDGQKLYRRIYAEIQKGHSVELDFAGVRKVFTPFLNASFGHLLEHYEKEKVMQKVILCNIEADHLQRVNSFIDQEDQRGSEATTREIMKELFADDELSDSEM